MTEIEGRGGTTMVAWETVAEDFVPDGSLRDVFVSGTDLSDWQRVVQYLLGSGLALRLTLNDEPADLTADGVEELFAAQEEASVLLTIDIAGMQLNCHFFWPADIEFDLDPKEVTETNFAALLEFMRSVGSRLEKDVVLAPENMPHHPFLVYSAERAAFDFVPSG